MPRYKVIYRNAPHGEPVHTLVEVATETDARLRVEADGGHVLAVMEARTTGFALVRDWFRWLLRSKLSIRFWVTDGERALFCEVLKTLYTAGVPLPQALQLTIDETPNRWLRRRLVIVLERLRQGDEFATALGDRRCRRAFPPLMRETIRTGASSGRLDDCLGRLAELYRRASEIRRQTITAMIYPTLAMIMFIVVCIVITIRVPPALKLAAGPDKFDAVKASLPIPIQILLYLDEHRGVLFAPPVAIGLWIFLRVAAKRLHWTRLQLAKLDKGVPMIGAIVYEFALVRFLDLLSANHQSGIQMVESLDLIRDCVAYPLIEDAIERVSDRILNAGSSLSAAIAQEDIFPGLVKQMVRAGEESGQLNETLFPIVLYYADRAKASLKRTLDTMPAIMILLLGAIIGPIVYGVYMSLTTIMLAMEVGLS
jgi:type II secretory pathway component PulF